MERTLRANGLDVDDDNMNKLREVKAANRHLHYAGDTEYTFVVRDMVKCLLKN